MDEVADPISDTPSLGGQEPLPSGAGQPEKSPKVPRRLALLIALGVMALLALGWAVDSLGGLAPAVRFSNGETQQAGLYRVALTLTPAVQHAGQPERYALAVTDLTGHAVNSLQVGLRLSMVTMEMPEITATATAAGNGVYSATATTSMAGEWQLEVTLTPPSGSSFHTQFDIATK